MHARNMRKDVAELFFLFQWLVALLIEIMFSTSKDCSGEKVHREVYVVLALLNYYIIIVVYSKIQLFQLTLRDKTVR